MSEETARMQWEQVYKAESATLFGYLCQRVKNDLAADIMQESFLELLQMMLRGTQIENFRAYLFQIARNRLYKNYKTAQRDQGGVINDNMAAAGRSAHEELLNNQLATDIEIARQSLDLIEQEVFELNWFYSLPQQEIARIIGKSDRHVRRIIESVITKMSAVLRDKGWRSSDGQ